MQNKFITNHIFMIEKAKKIFKALIIAFSVMMYITEVKAQEGGVRAEGIAGYNATFGFFAGSEVSADYMAPSWFLARGAFRYTSFPQYTLDLRPGIHYGLKFGEIYAEALFVGTFQGRSYNLCAGIDAGYRSKWFWASLGYYYRHLLPSDGSKGLSEPANIMYEAGVTVLPDIKRWDLEIVISNSRLCELERFYQPSLIIEGTYYPLPYLGICASAAVKRAGMFNISSNNYQEYLSLGVEYRW